MRGIFSVLGLVGVLLTIGLLAKKPLVPNAADASKLTPAQTQQQFKQALDAAMQTPRSEPDQK